MFSFQAENTLGRRIVERQPVVRIYGEEHPLRAEVVVMTADTFGMVGRALAGSPVAVHIVRGGAEKRRFVESLGCRTVAAVGNGANDVPMLRAAGLGIAVLGDEGTSGEAVRVATVVARDINVAIDLLLKPQRLVATLRR